MQHPEPALQRNPCRQSHSSRDGQEPGWALPSTSSQALFPSARRKSDGKTRDGQEVREVCFLHPSCILPAQFLHNSLSPCPMDTAVGLGSAGRNFQGQPRDEALSWLWSLGQGMLPLEPGTWNAAAP